MIYTVGEMAQKLGVPASTLRYYDKEGLLPFVERSSGGIRMFRENDFEWLQVIRCMKKAGMSIKDIRQYIELSIQGDDTKGLMDKAADIVPQVEQIMGKVDTLLTTLNTLAANPNLPSIMENAQSITANLNQSSRQLNLLLRNDLPELTGKMSRIGDNVITLTDHMNELDLQATLSKVDTTLGYVQLMTEKMNRKDNTLGLLLNDSALYNNLTHTAGSANNLLIDLKENPKRYVHFSLFGRKN